MVHETGTLVAPVRWGVDNFLCWLANGGSPKHCFSTLLRLKRKGFKGGEWCTCQTARCYGVDIACRLCFAHPCTNTVKSCYCIPSNYDQNVRSCESSHRASVFFSWIIRSCKVCSVRSGSQKANSQESTFSDIYFFLTLQFLSVSNAGLSKTFRGVHAMVTYCAIYEHCFRFWHCANVTAAVAVVP